MRLEGTVVARSTVKINEQDREVEILQTNFRSPLLAHWWERETSKEVWAVASSIREVREAFQEIPFLAAPSSNMHFGSSGQYSGTHALATALACRTGQEESDYLHYIDASEPSDEDIGFQQKILDRLGMREAWAIQKGSPTVRVAVIDTGVAYRHPDLAANIAMDPGGKTVLGFDFHNGALDPDDDHWHGTFCAGVVGAVGGNRIGMSGICQRVSLLPLKALDSFGFGTGNRAAEAVRFAVRREADVILCAWGSSKESSALKAAIEAAPKVVVVASVGNAEAKLKGDHFPASLSSSLSNVIAVGATDLEDTPLPSETTPDIYAPGEEVYSTFPPHLRYSPYHVGHGTSAAAAIVAGACALIKAELRKQGKTMSAAEIRTHLQTTADDIAPRDGNGTAGKRLNVGRALASLTGTRSPELQASPHSKNHPKKGAHGKKRQTAR